ncbi:hypothetical protein RchiOBHm_Chr4g0441821 [Rosa chinensis]|uniref:Uncharacterized protein n=1 Tax=Rosa chinensis TaxID=74649 RepID=A0A2P6R3G3_ROSCH|nr:hypothetical protein RchiOBHm_Chr4g0441821 [Rosa chinensis]
MDRSGGVIYGVSIGVLGCRRSLSGFGFIFGCFGFHPLGSGEQWSWCSLKRGGGGTLAASGGGGTVCTGL